MGHIGDQIRFQAFALYLLLKSRVQAASNVINVVSHCPLFSCQLFRIQAETGIAFCNTGDRII